MPEVEWGCEMVGGGLKVPIMKYTNHRDIMYNTVAIICVVYLKVSKRSEKFSSQEKNV